MVTTDRYTCRLLILSIIKIESIRKFYIYFQDLPVNNAEVVKRLIPQVFLCTPLCAMKSIKVSILPFMRSQQSLTRQTCCVSPFDLG